MQDISGFIVIVLSVALNVWRAKSKDRLMTAGVILAIFLNMIGVAIFFFVTRTKKAKPVRAQTNTMTSVGYQAKKK